MTTESLTMANFSRRVRWNTGQGIAATQMCRKLIDLDLHVDCYCFFTRLYLLYHEAQMYYMYSSVANVFFFCPIIVRLVKVK